MPYPLNEFHLFFKIPIVFKLYWIYGDFDRNHLGFEFLEYDGFAKNDSFLNEPKYTIDIYKIKLETIKQNAISAITDFSYNHIKNLQVLNIFYNKTIANIGTTKALFDLSTQTRLSPMDYFHVNQQEEPWEHPNPKYNPVPLSNMNSHFYNSVNEMFKEITCAEIDCLIDFSTSIATLRDEFIKQGSTHSYFFGDVKVLHAAIEILINKEVISENHKSDLKYLLLGNTSDFQNLPIIWKSTAKTFADFIDLLRSTTNNNKNNWQPFYDPQIIVYEYGGENKAFKNLDVALNKAKKNPCISAVQEIKDIL